MTSYPASMARGLALLACLSAVGLVGRAVSGRTAPAAAERSAGATSPVCERPVEISTGKGSLLGCGDTSHGMTCEPLAAGDLLRLQGQRCTRVAGGMRAGWRLLLGLPLNANAATAGDLALIRGIGPKTAQAVIDYRESQGFFSRMEDLMGVRGIGPGMLERLRPYLIVEPKP